MTLSYSGIVVDDKRATRDSATDKERDTTSFDAYPSSAPVITLTSASGHWAMLGSGGLAVMGLLVAATPRFAFLTDATNAGVVDVPDNDYPGTRDAIEELYRISGLTWGELAPVFGVDRRSLYLWARGGRASSTNESRLKRVLELVRGLEGKTSEDTRARLRDDKTGTSIYASLVQSANRQDQLSTDSPAGPIGTKSRQRPRRRVTDLLGAMHGTVHQDQGKFVSARPLRPRPR